METVNTFYTADPFEKRVYTVDEVQDILNISRTSAYILVKSGAFHTVKIGGSYRVSKKSFDAWLEGQKGDGE